MALNWTDRRVTAVCLAAQAVPVAATLANSGLGRFSGAFALVGWLPGPVIAGVLYSSFPIGARWEGQNRVNSAESTAFWSVALTVGLFYVVRLVYLVGVAVVAGEPSLGYGLDAEETLLSGRAGAALTVLLFEGPTAVFVGVITLIAAYFVGRVVYTLAELLDPG